TYQLKLEDTEGYANVDALWRSILPRPDLPPEGVLRTLDDQLSLKADTVLPLGPDTRDDYGLALVRSLYPVNNETAMRELVRFDYEGGPPKKETSDRYEWKLSTGGLKAGDRVEYWAEALDRNVITGPGKAESRHFKLEVVNPLAVIAKLDTRVRDYVKELRDILALQRTNRAETAGGVAFAGLITQEKEVRDRTGNLARSMREDRLPAATVVEALEQLGTGPMAEVLKLLESGQTRKDEAAAKKDRDASLPVQDRIIKELEEILTRLMRNEEAKKALRKMAKEDPEKHKV